VTCCQEPGQILIVPPEGGYDSFLEGAPADLSYTDVVSSIDEMLDAAERRSGPQETLFDLRAGWSRMSRPFVVQVPVEQVEQRLEALHAGTRGVTAALPNWRLSLQGAPATHDEVIAFLERSGLANLLVDGPGDRRVSVAVLDSGVEEEAVCCGSLEPVQIDTTGDPRGVRQPPSDAHGHGSTVARIIHYAFPPARIVSIRCFAGDRARLSDLVYGLLMGRLLWQSPDIFNMSFSVDAGFEVCPHCRHPLFGIDQHRALQQLFEHLRTELDDRPLLVAAAGNHHGPVAIPAALDGVLAVGSVGAGGSGRTEPDPAYDSIPADFILATGGSRDDPVSTGDGRHPRPLFGTSFSTALVAGVLASIVANGHVHGLGSARDEQHRIGALAVLREMAETAFPSYDPARHGIGLLGSRSPGALQPP
jgi:Subtilase family